MGQIKIVYELYDGRYLTEPDRAICHDVCDTYDEAKDSRKDYGDDTVIVKTKLQYFSSRKYIHLSSEVAYPRNKPNLNT